MEPFSLPKLDGACRFAACDDDLTNPGVAEPGRVRSPLE